MKNERKGEKNYQIKEVKIKEI
jgi:hypothetical protein